MANLKVTVLKDVTKTTGNALFKDIHLDLETGYSLTNALFKTDEVKDLKVDTDYDAIRNSVYNLFNTNQGERLLIPEYGLGLKRYLFEPISKQVGVLIGDTIKLGIAKFEPRVEVDKITVITDEDNSAYQITIALTINALSNRTVTIQGSLSNSGYQLIP